MTDAAPNNDRPSITRILGPWRATLLSGLLFAASHPPFDFGPLILVAFVPWLLSLERFKTTRSAILAGWCAGFLVYLLGLFYISQMPSLGGDSPITMYAMWVFISALLAVVFAAFSGVARFVASRVPRPWFVLLIPLLWTGFEFCHYYYPAPGPLMMTGHALHQVPVLIQIADLGSVHLVAFFIVLVNTCVFLWLDGRRRRVRSAECGVRSGKEDESASQDVNLQRLAIWALVIAFIVNIAYGSLRLYTLIPAIKDDGPLVAVIQPNIEQELKETRTEAARLEQFNRLRTLTGEALRYTPDLILWPETGYPWPINPRNPSSYDDLSRLASSIQTPMVVGAVAPLLEEDRKHYPYLTDRDAQLAWFNSGVYVGADGELFGRHDKAHLVPGGEYIPYRGTPLGDLVTDYARTLMGAVPEFLPGYRRDTFTLTDGMGRDWRFSMNICYEYWFPQLYGELHQPENVHFAVNLSNEVWYRQLAELDQALIGVKFRAIESRTTFVRATNDGISAVIDPLGNVRRTLTVDGKDRGVGGVMNVVLPVIENPEPTISLQAGMWVGWITMPLSLVIMVVSWVAWLRTRLRGNRDRTKVDARPI
ncbi:MAG: apolipoprotein N-acyltransferase [Planctomycetes bacterium]|nr:apolipoprotein N-acyltransferase [Planctomycetota bacterium]NUQ33494.1 apolipoprotein N-acyltransferase [Planctomycetaceae bacterium]